MGHRKPRLAFFIILLCVLQDVSRGGAQMPWGKAAACNGSRRKLPKLRPCPRRECRNRTPPPRLYSPPPPSRRGHCSPSRGTRPATAGRRRAENTLHSEIAHRRRCAAHHRRLAGALRRIRQALSGQPGRFMGNGHAGSAVPIGKRLLGVAWALPGGAPLPDAIDWQLPSHALPGGRAAGKALARGLGLCIVGAAPLPPPAPPAPAGCRA